MSGATRIGTVVLGERRPCIVAAGGEAEIGALAAAEGAALVELRADLFADPTPDRIRDALERVRAGGRPIVLTVRSAAEGGRAMPESQRAAIYEAGLPLADAIDVEIASDGLLDVLVPAARRTGKTIILSAHDFTATPSVDALLTHVGDALEAGADIPKIAAHATTPEDLRALIDVTREMLPAPVVTLAMGPYGPLSRIVLPAVGSVLTYAAAGVPTAPGQTSLAELARLVDALFPA